MANYGLSRVVYPEQEMSRKSNAVDPAYWKKTKGPEPIRFVCYLSNLEMGSSDPDAIKVRLHNGQEVWVNRLELISAFIKFGIVVKPEKDKLFDVIDFFRGDISMLANAKGSEKKMKIIEDAMGRFVEIMAKIFPRAPINISNFINWGGQTGTSLTIAKQTAKTRLIFAKKGFDVPANISNFLA